MAKATRDSPRHSGSDLRAAEILVEQGCILQPHDMEMGAAPFIPRPFARRRPGTVERGLCSTVAAADGRAVRRQSVPATALLSVSGLHQTIADDFQSCISARSVRWVFDLLTHDIRSWRTTGVAHPRRRGTRLGSVAERHGSLPVHLLPTSRGLDCRPVMAKSPMAWSASECISR